jgi:hypothetical protein
VVHLPELAYTRQREPFLAWQQGKTQLSLHAEFGKAVSFRTAVPGVANFADANVGWFAVRLSGGTQEAVPVDKPDAHGAVTYRFPVQGPAMLMLCAGPKEPLREDSWQRVSHCTKMMVAVGDRRRVDDDLDTTATTGLPIEVIPLISPFAATVGMELPARFKFLGRKQGNIEVAALRPDGSLDRQVTSPSGVANFELSQPGRWTIRFVRTEPDGERVGELVFDVPEAGQ